MGKIKRKNHKPDEMLLGENRLQRKQIKKLQQEIRRLQKELSYKQYDTVKEAKRPVKIYDLCTACGKGELTELILANRKFEICELCGYRSLAIKL